MWKVLVVPTAMLSPESNTLRTPSPPSSTRPSGPSGSLPAARSVWKISISWALGPRSVTARSISPAGSDAGAGWMAKSCSVTGSGVTSAAAVGALAADDDPTASVVFLLLSSTARAANPTATRAATMATDAINTATTATVSLSPEWALAAGSSPRSSIGISNPPSSAGSEPRLRGATAQTTPGIAECGADSWGLPATAQALAVAAVFELAIPVSRAFDSLRSLGATWRGDPPG